MNEQLDEKYLFSKQLVAEIIYGVDKAKEYMDKCVFMPDVQVIVNAHNNSLKEEKIKELEKIELNDIGPVYAWTTGNDTDMAMLISERIKELRGSK